MKCLRCLLVAVAVALSAPLFAAPDTSNDAKPVRRFRFRASFLSFGGKVSAGGVESGMRAAGLDQPLALQTLDGDIAAFLAPILEIFGAWGGPGDFSIPNSYPYSNLTGDVPRTFTVGYRVKPRLELSVIVDSAAQRLGYTTGHRATPAAFLDVSREMRSYAALASYAPPRSPLRAGLGVSLNSLKMGANQATRSSTRLGLLGEVALVAPARSRVFVDTALQYRWVASPKIGPIPITDEQGTTVTTFPSTPVSFSRWTMSLGVGFRL